MKNEGTKEEAQTEMLTVAEAAAAGHVSEQAIYNAIYRKRLPAEKKYGRIVLIAKEELEKYLAGKTIGRPVGSTKKQDAGGETGQKDTAGA